MKGIVITYAYKRWGEWYLGKYVTRTKLALDQTTMEVFLPEIKEKECSVPIILLEIKEEDYA